MGLSVREAPAQKPIAGQEKALLPWIDWFSHVAQILAALTLSGPTELRPIALLWEGRQYWDSTLQKPVYLSSAGDPNVWKDAAGNVV